MKYVNLNQRTPSWHTDRVNEQMSRGLFSPTSIFWRVNREALLLFSGPRALLLELAHPLVAAGVAQHSDFRRDPFGRLFRTVRVMVDLNFGELQQAHHAAQRTGRCHQPVQGQLTSDVGPYLAGTPYQAHDPFLKLWVLATLIDSIFVVHDLLIRPLTLDEKQAYYVDCHELARAFGLPPVLMPPTYADFETYMDTMLMSDLLTVGPEARAIVQALFEAPWMGPLARYGSFVSVGLLPARLRAEFGLQWDSEHEAQLQRWGAWSRALRAHVPTPLCVYPQATLAEVIRSKTASLHRPTPHQP